jgi:hypothetical protein
MGTSATRQWPPSPRKHARRRRRRKEQVLRIKGVKKGVKARCAAPWLKFKMVARKLSSGAGKFDDLRFGGCAVVDGDGAGFCALRFG